MVSFVLDPFTQRNCSGEGLLILSPEPLRSSFRDCGQRDSPSVLSALCLETTEPSESNSALVANFYSLWRS